MSVSKNIKTITIKIFTEIGNELVIKNCRHLSPQLLPLKSFSLNLYIKQ